MKKSASMLLLVVSVLMMTHSYAFPDSAEVLPKGVSHIGISTNIYLPVEERFDPDGKVEDTAIDYNGVLGENLGLPSGLNVGTSIVSFKYDFRKIEFTYNYGVTDRLMVGIIIPYWWIKNKVDARLDTSGANTGKSVTGAGFGFPIAPFGTFGDEVPLTKEDVQDILGKGLDVDNDGTIDVSGLGFKRFETWSKQGFGDIEAAFKYQYMKNEKFALAFGGGIFFPTGWKDDPDNLVDYGIGGSAYGIGLRSYNDYSGIKDLSLNATLKYAHAFPYKQTMRVPSDINAPITPAKEKVKVRPGDTYELSVSGSYAITKALSASLLYQYGMGTGNKVSGSGVVDVLEEETDYTEHLYIASLSYSTISQFLEKKFPIPLSFTVSYRDRFAGENCLKSKYLSFNLSVYFK